MKRINSTRFLTQEELAEQLVELDMDQEVYQTGGIPLLVKNRKIYVDNTDSHTMIFGATGSKKTRMFAMPAIGVFARAGESFVVTDPKGELFERTAGDVEQHGFHICCLNLRDFKAGVSWNPLALPYKYYHNGKRTKALEFVSEMAKMIIQMDSTEEKFWTTTAADIFVGFTILLFEEAKPEECSLKSLVELWNFYLDDRKEMREKLKKYKNTLIYQKLEYLNNSSEKTLGSMEAFITMGLNKLSINEEFMQFLSMPGMNMEQLTEEKNAIYLIIPDENTSYHFVASLFLEQLYEVLIQRAQMEADNRLPIRMNFLIDEFANIPKIENMDAMITASRSRNIRFHLIVQGVKQLYQKYEDSAEVISGNCNNWIYLYSKEFELLQNLSRLCGEVVYDNNVRMPLFSEFDLQHLNKEEGEALVLAGRNCPCLSNLADINEYPYPILKVQEITTGEWEELKICEVDDRKVKQYFLPPSKEQIELHIPAWLEEYPRWLVAVGPEGMIFGEEMVTDMDLVQNIAIGKMAHRLSKEEHFEIEKFEWFSASKDMRSRYYQILKDHPEKVYLTIDELGADNFVSEGGLFKEIKRDEVLKKYQITLSTLDTLQSLDDEIIFSEKVPNYGGVVGLRYAYNVLFREANTALKGTEFEHGVWKQEEGRRRKIIFCKRARTWLCAKASVSES